MRKLMKWLKQIWERLVGDGVPGYFNYAEIRKEEQKKEHNIAAANELLGRNSFQNYIR